MTESTAAPESTRMRLTVVGLSLAVVLAVVLVLEGAPPAVGATEPGALAKLNVALNATSFACLLAGFVAVRRGRIAVHRACMLTAFGVSSAFLVSYLLHHAQVGSVPFRGSGAWRTLYFAILIPHVILAAVIVPLALFTLVRGWTGRIAAHRRVARWTLPLWLYVSGSGVLVYLLLYRSVS
jgi:putative membrane protein